MADDPAPEDDAGPPDVAGSAAADGAASDDRSAGDSHGGDELRAQVVDLIERTQAAMVGFGRAFTDSVLNVVPGDTSALDEIIDRAFDLTEKVLQSQREFAKSVLDAATRQLEEERRRND